MQGKGREEECQGGGGGRAGGVGAGGGGAGETVLSFAFASVSATRPLFAARCMGKPSKCGVAVDLIVVGIRLLTGIAGHAPLEGLV